MKAAVLVPGGTPMLEIEEVGRPELQPGHVLLRVLACGVCRTDLHIAEGDLPPLRSHLIPGHQIVGEVVAGPTAELPLGKPCWSVLDRWHRWGLLVLPPRPGESLRPPYVYRVHGEWRLRGICPGSRGFRLSPCLKVLITSTSLPCFAPELLAFVA